MLLDTIYTETINETAFDEKGVSVSVLRLDMIHPLTGGNKWFKLKYNLDAFLKSGKECLVTLGGAYSNHIIATAAAGKEYGIQTAGIIRGEELKVNSNAHLKFAASCGMKLFFVSRDEYRQIRQTEIIPERIYSILHSSKLYFLPEGGSNALAIKGCSEITNLITNHFDYIVCAVGTGATLAGIAGALDVHQTAIGISVLEGKKFLDANISVLTGNKKNFSLFHDYSFGGYASTNAELERFCKSFSAKHLIPIEPIYTGKMFFGLFDLIRNNHFKPGSRIIALHTGGMPGIKN